MTALPPLRPSMLFSDGLHYVRAASVKDRHPNRFVVCQHRLEGFDRNRALPRHVPTLEEGRTICGHLSRKAIKENPDLKEKAKLVRAKAEKASRRKAERKLARSKSVPFPTTRFVCTQATSAAQVWCCIKDREDTRPIGRRAQGGHLAQLDSLPHEKGDYAVLRGDDPVLDDNGVPKVFKTWMEAEEGMLQVYNEMPEDERYPMGTTTVYANRTISVHFDPDNNSITRPFNLYTPIYHKPILHPIRQEPVMYKKITSAIAQADELDRIIRGAI